MASDRIETHTFQAEIKQLLDLVIHSLYTHPEIFLRELLSNASDALDRLRFRAVTEPALAEGAPLEIRLVPDKAAGTLTIEDTGEGMDHDALVRNLGTIAHSGSKAFIEKLKEAGKNDAQLIGQFGVGFYSSYLVAEKVDVVSRAAGSEQAFRWSSDAQGSFTVEPAEREERGTSVVLHLKEEHQGFLEPWQLKDRVRQYSDYLGHPIKLRITETSTSGDTASDDAAPDSKQGDGEKDASEKAPTSRWETINQGGALWQRPKSEITDEQYEEFYKHLTHDFEGPLAKTHFTAEGTQQFTGLLFIPKKAPFDLHQPERRGVRLFVRRVFVMDRCEELLPQWLRFVRGVVDSDDLPLNVSRQVLQDSQGTRIIRKQVVKKTLDLLDRVAKEQPEDYLKLWEAYGTVLKEGLTMDREYASRLTKLVRFRSSHGEGLTSLEEYVGRMKEGQPAIYYALGESVASLARSPHLEALRGKDYEVLYLTDPVDEWAIQGIGEHDGKPLLSAMQADLDLGESEEERKEEEEKEGSETKRLEGLLGRMKEILGTRIGEVRISTRLTDSPCCLVVPQGGTHAYLERLLKERGHGVPGAKRILEVNPGHPLIERMEALHSRDASSAKLGEWVELLHEQALLAEGSVPEDPVGFARRVTELLTRTAELDASSNRTGSTGTGSGSGGDSTSSVSGGESASSGAGASSGVPGAEAGSGSTDAAPPVEVGSDADPTTPPRASA